MLTWLPVPLKREKSLLIWIADMKNQEIYAHLASRAIKTRNIKAHSDRGYEKPKNLCLLGSRAIINVKTSMLIWITDMKNQEIYAHLALVPLKRETSMLIWIADMEKPRNLCSLGSRAIKT